MGTRHSISFILCAAGALAMVADEASTAQRFQRALASDPQLIAFLKAMPKGADLHNHASGAVYGETWLDAAIASKLFFNPQNGDFSDSQGGCYLVPAAQLYNIGAYASTFLDAASMRGYFQGATSDSHDHFFATFGKFNKLQSQVLQEDQLAEAVNQAKAQNVQYLEVSTSVVPSDKLNDFLKTLGADLAGRLNAWNKLDESTRATTLKAALEAIKPHLRELNAPSKNLLNDLDTKVATRAGQPAPISGPQGAVQLRYIAGLPRKIDNASFFGQMACAMHLAKQDSRIAGITILQEEDDVRARQNFEAQMAIIDFLWKDQGKPNMALHAGELTTRNSPLDVLRCRIRKSVELGHTQRIGHGVSIGWEDNLEDLLKQLREKGVAIEICLSSNDLILGVAGEAHPFNLYQEAGIPMTLNTDDAGVNRSTLTQEFLRAVRTYKLGYKDLKGLARNSLTYSFLPGESLHQKGQPRSEFAGLGTPDWRPGKKAQSLMQVNPKLAAEVKLEQAFAAFEN